MECFEQDEYLFFFFFFVTRHTFNQQGGQRHYNSSKGERGWIFTTTNGRGRNGVGSRWECSPRTLEPRPNTPHGGRRSLHFCEFFLLPK
jgi:hypothetical protein